MPLSQLTTAVDSSITPEEPPAGLATFDQLSNFSLPLSKESSPPPAPTLLSRSPPSWRHHPYQHSQRPPRPAGNNRQMTAFPEALSPPITTAMDQQYFQSYASAPSAEPISPYQYSPGQQPAGYMNHQQQRHPSQSVPSCGPPYSTAQYTQAPGQQPLPMPHMDLAPLGPRPHQYTVQPSAGIGASETLAYHPHRQDSLAAARRATVPGTLTNQPDQRIPRTQTSISGDMSSMFRANTSSDGNYHSSPTDEGQVGPNGKVSIASTISRENRALCVTKDDKIVLNDKTPDEDRILFNIHNQQINSRGKGMWDNITSQYYKVLGEKVPSTPRLQMKYVRALRKHFMLPEESFARLMTIYEDDERNRFNRIWKAFRDSGAVGCDVKAAEIECYLVRLGLESPSQDEATKVRRRRRSKQQQKRSALPTDQLQGSQGMAWNNYGQVNVEGHHQYPLPGMTGHHQHPAQNAAGFEFQPAMAVPLSNAQEDTLMMEIEVKYGRSPAEMCSNGSPGPSTPGSSPHDATHNTMLAAAAELNANSRTLPSPTTHMPPYGSMTRMPFNDQAGHVKHDVWR